MEVGTSTVEVRQGCKDDGKLNLCAGKDVVDEGGERRVVTAALEGAAASGTGRAAEGGVYGFFDCINEVVCGIMLEVDRVADGC